MEMVEPKRLTTPESAGGSKVLLFLLQLLFSSCGSPLWFQTFEFYVRVVHEGQRISDGVMPGLFSNQPVHRLTDSAICGMTLGCCS